MYPNSDIWLVGAQLLVCFVRQHADSATAGHSLGGSLASLIGVTFGVPVVAFEAPGEKLAATRLHLPSPVRVHFVFDHVPVSENVICSLPRNISRTYTTLQTRLPWVHVTASHRLAQ